MRGGKKPKIFILMPFSAKFDAVYRLGIKAACEECGAVAERVDEQIFSESIVERIYGQIEEADLLIADMSNRNPNVFYEVGYAHAKSRKVVLVTKKAKDIPFDLKAYPHVIYGDDIELLRAELVRRIRFFLRETKEGRTKVEPAVLVYNGGKPVALTHGQADRVWPRIVAGFGHNTSNLLQPFPSPWLASFESNSPARSTTSSTAATTAVISS